MATKLEQIVSFDDVMMVFLDRMNTEEKFKPDGSVYHIYLGNKGNNTSVTFLLTPAGIDDPEERERHTFATKYIKKNHIITKYGFIDKIKMNNSKSTYFLKEPFDDAKIFQFAVDMYNSMMEKKREDEAKRVKELSEIDLSANIPTIPIPSTSEFESFEDPQTSHIESSSSPLEESSEHETHFIVPGNPRNVRLRSIQDVADRVSSGEITAMLKMNKDDPGNAAMLEILSVDNDRNLSVAERYVIKQELKKIGNLSREQQLEALAQVGKRILREKERALKRTYEKKTRLKEGTVADPMKIVKSLKIRPAFAK